MKLYLLLFPLLCYCGPADCPNPGQEAGSLPPAIAYGSECVADRGENCSDYPWLWLDSNGGVHQCDQDPCPIGSVCQFTAAGPSGVCQ